MRPPRPSPWPLIWRAGAVVLALAGATCAALWVWPGYLLPKPWRRPGPPPKSIAVFFSADVRGYLEPCGCTEQRWGGVARMMGAIQRLGDPNTLLAVDVGDMVAGTQLWQRIEWDHYLAALGRMNFTAANLGASEITLSAAAIRQAAGQSPVPLVSANVRDAASGELLLPPYRQVLIHNLRVTLVGAVVGDPHVALGEGVAVADVDESLGKLLPALRRETDVIVLLAAADEAAIRHFAQAHPEIDAILGGRVQQASREVEMVGACRLAWLANKGQMIGRMEIDIRPDGMPAAARSNMFVLDNDVPEARPMLDLIRDYNGRLAQLNRTGGLAALGVPVLAPPAGSNTYAGAEACKACHPKGYDAWTKTGHRTAFESLVARQREGNPGCVACHVVDLGAGDGFRGAAVTPGRLGVQCESCHGRSSDHVKARQAGVIDKLPKVLPKSCETCHDCVHSPDFSYLPYWEKIKHDRQ